MACSVGDADPPQVWHSPDIREALLLNGEQLARAIFSRGRRLTCVRDVHEQQGPATR
jgi:hypothetical protein